MSPGREVPPGALPRLHVVTDDRVLGRPGWALEAGRVLAAGGAALALHVRGPGLEGREVWERVRALVEPAAAAGAALVVNDRVDVALVLPVRGVQLGRRSLPVVAARRLLPGGTWVGASVHDAAGALAAEEEDADYAVVGTVFATASHPDRAGAGPELVREASARSRLPLVAIGGITPERVGEVREASAYGVAVLSGVWDAPDPSAAVGAYLEALA